MKPKVLIIVSGGNVQSVVVNQDTDVILIDHDNIDAGDPPVNYYPSEKFDDGEAHQLFTHTNDKREEEIHDELKRLKF
jgi:hypothetical protein